MMMSPITSYEEKMTCRSTGSSALPRRDLRLLDIPSFISLRNNIDPPLSVICLVVLLPC
jgi:hypothetical protein